MTLAISYIRFSTKAQKVGRSHDRQLEAYEAWVAKMGFTPADDNFLDEGRSGYSGEHLGEKGQLKRFLDKVEVDKKIPRGSYLVIESLDRLSRQNIDDALALFLRIRSAGIHICTLMDSERVYSPGGDVSQLIMSMLVMARANEESETKSKRGKDKWQEKFALARAEKKPYGKRVPRWLALVDEAYVPIPERVAIVERVFKATLAGHGFVAIARQLNADKIPAFRGGTWCSSSVDDMLKNRCVLGEWQPKDGGSAIPDYFPRIIDDATFELAANEMFRRRRNVTKQTKNFQVWQQVGQCALCSAPMYLVQKNKKFIGGKLYIYKYLLCSSKRKGLCMQAANIRLADSEAVFKEILVNVGALGLIQTEAAAITDAMAVVDASLHSEQTTRARHMKRLAEPDAPEFLYELVATADQNIKRLKAERAELERKHTAQTIAQSDKAWLLDNLPMVERDDRQRANALLVRLGVVATIKGGDVPLFNVYQKERLIMEIRVVDGKPKTTSHSSEVSERMFNQGELREDELYINVGFGSKKLPKPKRSEDADVTPPVVSPVQPGDGPDWTGYDEELPDEANELLGITGFGDDPVFHETPLHAPDD